MRTLLGVLCVLGTPSLLAACDDTCGAGAVHGGDFTFSERESEGSLDDLRCVEVVTGDLRIVGGDARSLTHLRHVLGDVDLRSTEVSLPNLALVSGDVDISGGNSLAGLSGLEVVEGDFSISNVKRIENLKQLESLQRVEGTLTLDDLPKLKSLPGPENLEAVHTLVLEGELALTKWKGFKKEGRPLGEVVLHSLKVQHTEGLAEIDLGGFFLDGPVVIWNNESLRRVEVGTNGRLSEEEQQRARGLPFDSRCAGLDDGTLAVKGNPKLEVLRFAVRQHESIDVWNNPELRHFEGLDTLGFYGELECMRLRTLPSLESVELPDSRVTVERSLEIGRTGLTDLRGLVERDYDDGPGSLRVGCQLLLSGNPELTTLDGVELHLGVGATLIDNPTLPQCLLDALELEESAVLDPTLCLFGEQGIYSSGNDDDAVCM